ncbi:MAG: hypothetical protein ACEPO8_11155 [Rhodothermaceae bacterium]
MIKKPLKKELESEKGKNKLSFGRISQLYGNEHQCQEFLHWKTGGYNFCENKVQKGNFNFGTLVA